MLTSELNDLQLEMSSYQEKQNELLSFTAKLTEKNTHLQSENSLINEKLAQVDLEFTQTKHKLEASNKELNMNLQVLNANLLDELAKNKTLFQELEEKKKEVGIFKEPPFLFCFSIFLCINRSRNCLSSCRMSRMRTPR